MVRWPSCDGAVAVMGWCGGRHVMVWWPSCDGIMWCNHLLAMISFSNVHLCAQHTSWSNRIYII